MAIGAVGAAVLARALGVKDFGVYSVALATYYLLLGGTDFGFSAVAAREMARRPDEQAKVLRAALHVNVAWALLFAAIGAAVALIGGLGTTRWQALAVLVPAVALSGLVPARQAFLVRYRTRRLTSIDLGTNVLQTAAAVAAALLGLGVVGVAAAMSAGFAANAVVTAFVARQDLRSAPADRDERVAILRGSLPLGFASLVASIYFTVDVILLGWLVSDQDIGRYAAAVKILAILTAGPGLVMQAALPAFAVTADDRAALGAFAARVWHWLTAVGLPLCAGVIVFAGPIVRLAFGEEYAASIPLMRILGGAGIAILGANLVGNLMTARGMGRRMLWQNLLALAFNVAGNLVLVPSYGVTASAWMTLATELFVTVCGLLTLRHALDWGPTLRVTLGPVVAAITAAAAATILLRWPVIAVPVFALSYAGLIWLFEAWPEELRPAGRRVGPTIWNP
jgi:O-antigen/teichoic acid export membrane protein